jgi:hypothetical protein
LEAKNSNKKIKIYLYIISLNILFILAILKILFLNLQKLYKYIGFNVTKVIDFLKSYTFCELVSKIENLFLLCICIVLFIVSECLLHKVINKKFKDNSNIPVKIVNLENKDTEAITFMVTYIVPLLFIDLERCYDIVIGILILILVGSMSIKTNLYLSNPTLSLRGFKLYKASIELNKEAISRTKTIISLMDLKKGDEIEYINISEDEYYVVNSRRG